MDRLAAVDAQTYWMSASVPNDQFLLYAFAGNPGDLGALLDRLRRRADACPDLRLRIADDCRLSYPRWVQRPVDASQFLVHAVDAGLTWADCLDAVARLSDDRLDPTHAAWRLHIFPDVGEVPGTDRAAVAVVQIAHALADGTRTAQIAAWLFGRDRPVPDIPPGGGGNLLVRGVAAGRAHRQFLADIAAGRLQAPPPPRPVLRTNTPPVGRIRVRSLVLDRRVLTASGTRWTQLALRRERMTTRPAPPLSWNVRACSRSTRANPR